jgi:hypothetical protein
MVDIIDEFILAIDKFRTSKVSDFSKFNSGLDELTEIMIERAPGQRRCQAGIDKLTYLLQVQLDSSFEIYLSPKKILRIFFTKTSLFTSHP